MQILATVTPWTHPLATIKHLDPPSIRAAPGEAQLPIAATGTKVGLD